MLRVENLSAFYGTSRALFDVSFTVAAGEVTTLLGRNGMGKTTTVRAIFNLLRGVRGSVTFEGASLSGKTPYRIAQAGLGLVPEGRHIFPSLTVRENLVATAADRSGGRQWTLDRIYDLFPPLAARRRHYGSELSGGEQQMLAIGRALMTNPKLLVLDEATEGLAPLVRQQIWSSLAEIKRERLSILLIDKHIDSMLKLADRHVVLEKGHVVWTGSSAALAADTTAMQTYLSI
jgi:branched-chain amino acid transport system ATP-binding protein